jgi:hypothetical protein
MKIDRSGAVALMLVVTMATLGLAPPARANDEASEATFVGRVLSADGITPLGGVGIILLDLEKQSEYRSSPTHDNGGFTVSVPPGTYTVLIDTPDGAYLASNGLALDAGPNQPLLLAISNDPAAAQPPGLAASGGWPTWLQWVVVGAVVIVGAAVVNEVTGDQEPISTPF